MLLYPIEGLQGLSEGEGLQALSILYGYTAARWEEEPPAGRGNATLRISAVRILCHIRTFNDEELIERCVAAVLAQTRSPDQLLIVDNASVYGRKRAGASR